MGDTDNARRLVAIAETHRDEFALWSANILEEAAAKALSAANARRKPNGAAAPLANAVDNANVQ
jgi:hypothetical protein